jgi:hypothetical protein
MISFGWLASGASFTPLVRLPAHIIASSTQFDDHYKVENLLDGKVATEYASQNGGTNTTVEFDFGAAVQIEAFRHLDRNDPATIAMSELEFFDGNGQLVSSMSVTHINRPGGETFLILPSPVTAQRVRWRVTKVGDPSCIAVGGAEISFLTSEASDPLPRRDRIEAMCLPCVDKAGNQPVQITIDHPYKEPADVSLNIGGTASKAHLSGGKNSIELNLPAVQSETTQRLELQFEGQTVVASELQQKAVRPLTVYLLPMSHTDIGYALSQSASADRQVSNLLAGIAAAKRTADYPPGARFVWNVEVLWAADLYLQRMNEEQRADFLTAIKKGQVELNGSYANELTGLCRPEELVQLFRLATEMSQQSGVPIQSAMISDVPGYTRGTVTAMSQAGIKYFSAAPNYFDRIGTIFRDCENKPFYWVAADGKTKVLTWIPFWGYAMSHIYQHMSLKLVSDLSEKLDQNQYPYDITYVRWAGHEDNAEPDPVICDFVRDWNAKYAWPHFIISGTTEAFQAFEQRYGKTLPRLQGDWTPYWEDGAGSTARETAMNRNSADRLAQAETLWAMFDYKDYPVADFNEAWRNILLYSEHTWGADCSISRAESDKTKEQWEVKKAFAEDADRQSCGLVAKALDVKFGTLGAGGPQTNWIDVINTLSWRRGGLATISPERSLAGDQVNDEKGQPVASQRLRSGELAFWVDGAPPFAVKRYAISAGAAYSDKQAAVVQDTGLDNGTVQVRVDGKTGGIVEISGKGFEGNLVDVSGGEELNDYLYLQGDDLENLHRNSPVKISVGEKGPLVASLIIESDAPGCNRLRREVRLVAGQDYVEINNLVDKAKLQAADYWATKESVNFAFPFHVPDGKVLMDIPLGGTVRPEVDQLPGSCKNWFTVGRWVDVANQKQGVTWVTLDAPLIEVGGITARLLNSQTNPEVWRQKVAPTQLFYSWVMNNHWSSNYRAFQEGPVTFRYILRPHHKTDPAENTRFATGFSQPLLADAALPGKTRSTPRLTLSSDDVVVDGFKPSDDGKGWIVRLYGASGKESAVKLQWGDQVPKAVFLSNTSEASVEKIGERVSVPGYGLVTLRIETEN